MKKAVSLIVILTGCIFMSLTLPDIIQSLRIKKQGISVEGTVVNIEQLGRKTELEKVTVSFFTREGNPVTASASKRGYISPEEKTMIWYDQSNPQKIDFGDTIGYNMRGAILGFLILIFGIINFIRFFISDKAKRSLIRTGKKIAAESISVDRNERYGMGDKNPWVIKCKWTDNTNNKEYYFKSKDYTIDPAPYLTGRSQIDIFIDPVDPGKYFMDTSFMPKGNNTIG